MTLTVTEVYMDKINDTSQLSEKEKEIYLMGYNRAMAEMNEMKKALIKFVEEYVCHSEEV